MKRKVMLVVFAVSAINCFAAGGYYEPGVSGWFTILGIVLIAWGILEIILFFKIWGLTNDIRALKKDYFCEVEKERLLQNLRDNVVLGNTDKVKKVLLKNFINEVLSSFDSLKQGEPENGQWVSYKEKNLQTTILPYVQKLQNQFERIGEDLPSCILNLKTYDDFFNIFAEEDFEMKKKEEKKKESESYWESNTTNK